MRLNQVKIENFRSIEDESFSFKIPFRILVGKNESGKSSLLKALSYLDQNIEISPSDIKQSLEISDEELKSEVTFEFELNTQELEQVYKSVRSKLHSSDKSIDELKMVKFDEHELTLNEICKKISTCLYWVQVTKKSKSHTYWRYNKSWAIIPTFIMYNPTNNRTNDKPYNKYIFIDTRDLSEEEKKPFVKLEASHLYNVISDENVVILKSKHPNVIKWEYKETDLLNDEINMDEFIANPDLFKPLKVMFELAGISNIKDSLNKVRSAKNYHRLDNYLERIAIKTTQHFKKIWNEYPEVEFILNANADSIITGIKEKNTFSLRQRSDGFKRFITFLLLVSAVYETDSLKDTVLLIDEPDVSLHPSGIRFLRDELIKISNHNYVVASTHSIFLIDRNNINRHYIVKKENEVSTIEEANDDNLITEEVLYNALGFSFYEILKETNIVFEGWRDKELFKKAMERVPAEFKEIKETLKNVGIAHINGVKEGQSITPIFELTKRKLLIISDDDDIARQYQKNFLKQNSYGRWLTYQDFDESLQNHTGEDFLKEEYHRATLVLLKKTHRNLTNEPNFSEKIPKIKALDKWLINECAITDKQQRNIIINDYKETLFTNLKNSNIEVKYFEFLKILNSKIQE